MIDLNMKPKKHEQSETPGAEEIAAAVIAIALWTAIVIGWIGAL